jgi:hypothetical protein
MEGNVSCYMDVTYEVDDRSRLTRCYCRTLVLADAVKNGYRSCKSGELLRDKEKERQAWPKPVRRIELWMRTRMWERSYSVKCSHSTAINNDVWSLMKLHKANRASLTRLGPTWGRACSRFALQISALMVIAYFICRRRHRTPFSSLIESVSFALT